MAARPEARPADLTRRTLLWSAPVLTAITAAPAAAASSAVDGSADATAGTAADAPADTRGAVRVTATPPVVPPGTVFPDIRIALSYLATGEIVPTDTATVWVVLAGGFTWEDGTDLAEPRMIAPGPQGIAKGEVHLVPGAYGVRSPRLGGLRSGTIAVSAADPQAPSDRPNSYEQLDPEG